MTIIPPSLSLSLPSSISPLPITLPSRKRLEPSLGATRCRAALLTLSDLNWFSLSSARAAVSHINARKQGFLLDPSPPLFLLPSIVCTYSYYSYVLYSGGRPMPLPFPAHISSVLEAFLIHMEEAAEAEAEEEEEDVGWL